MLALEIIGVILGVLLLLLLIPLRVEIGFEEEFALTLRYAFLKFRLLPAREDPKKEARRKKKEEKKRQKEEKRKQKYPEQVEKSTGDQLREIFHRTGVRGLVSALTDLAKLAAHSLKRVFAHLRFKAFDLYLCVGGAEDAAQAAIQYGEFSAGVYAATGIFFSRKPCKKLGVTVDLDYTRDKTVAVFNGKASILPLFLAREAVTLLFRGFPVVWRLIRPPKQKALPAPRREAYRQLKRPGDGAKGESV